MCVVSLGISEIIVMCKYETRNICELGNVGKIIMTILFK